MTERRRRRSDVVVSIDGWIVRDYANPSQPPVLSCPKCGGPVVECSATQTVHCAKCNRIWTLELVQACQLPIDDVREQISKRLQARCLPSFATTRRNRGG